MEVPHGFESEKPNISRERIAEVLQCVKRSSTPGLPLLYLRTTKGEMIDTYMALLIDLVQERIEGYNTYDADAFTTMELFDLGLLDICRTFVKNEAHSEQKHLTGRYRLIISVSIIDEVICRLLLGRRISHCAENSFRLAGKPGTGFNTDEQCDDFFQNLKPHLDELVESDVQAFDFSLQRWLFDDITDSILTLTDCDQNSCYPRILRNYVACSCRSLLATSDGKCVELQFPGIQRTGCYWTASMNSWIREYMVYLAGGDVCVTYGDDCVENTPLDGIRERYADFGITLTDVRECKSTNSINFCSVDFSNDTNIKSNVVKPLWNFLHQQDITIEMVDQFVNDFRNNPEFGDLLECAAMKLDELDALGVVDPEKQ